jgi:hypothetical protein
LPQESHQKAEKMKPFLLILALFVIYARCEIKEEESGECASDKLSCVNRRKSVGRYEQVRKRVERVRQACGQVSHDAGRLVRQQLI